MADQGKRTGVASTSGRRGPKLRLRADLRVEEVGDELAILDVAGDSLHRVSTESAEAVRLLQRGVRSSEVPAELQGAVDDLAEAGLVDGTPQISRRAAIVGAGGAAFAAATVTTFALADPAAASTMCGMSVTPTGGVALTSSNSAYSYTTGPGGFGMGSYNLQFRAWGGGGAGGGSMWSGGKAGGGGGGGAYAGDTYSVTECATYIFNVTVGAGGTGSDDAAGTAGGLSSVKDGSTTIVQAAPGSGGGRGYAGGYGAGGAGGTTAASTGSVKHKGGTGATRSSTYTSGGGGGGAGGSGGDGADGSGVTGGGGGTDFGGDGAFGGAGANGVGMNDDGAAGSFPGGGGSGAGGPDNPDSDKGGAGAPGLVWIGQ